MILAEGRNALTDGWMLIADKLYHLPQAEPIWR